MRALAPYASAPETLARVIALGVLALVFLRLKRQKWALWQRPWLAIFAVSFGLYMLLPNGSFGYWFLSERLSLFPWLALVPLMISSILSYEGGSEARDRT